MRGKNITHIYQCLTQFVYELNLATAWDYMKNEPWCSVETNWPTDLAPQQFKADCRWTHSPSASPASLLSEWRLQANGKQGFLFRRVGLLTPRTQKSKSVLLTITDRQDPTTGARSTICVHVFNGCASASACAHVLVSASACAYFWMKEAVWEKKKRWSNCYFSVKATLPLGCAKRQ